MLRISPKIEIINHFDNLINRVDIDFDSCLEKYNSQVLGELLSSEAVNNRTNYHNKFKEFNLEVHQESTKHIDYQTFDLWTESTKITDYLSQVRNRTIEELKKAQEDSLEYYKINSWRFKSELIGEKNIDELKSELFAENYFQIHIKQSEKRFWAFNLFTFVTDFYMSPSDIESLENLINKENEPFKQVSVPVFDEKMVLIGLLYYSFVQNLLLKIPNHVIRVQKQDVLNIESIEFQYKYCGVNLTCSSIDLSNLVNLHLFGTDCHDRDESIEIKIEGLSSVKQMFLEVNSDKIYLSIRNLCSVEQLGLSSKPGMLDASFMSDLFDQMPNIEILHLYGTFSYFNLDKLINLKELVLGGNINEDFNFELFKNLNNQFEFLKIFFTNIDYDYEILLKLLGAHKFSYLLSLELLNCNIKRIEKKFIDKFPILKKLLMIECNLEMIEDDALSNLKQLVALDLSSNNFEKLEGNILSGLVNLEYFSMSENRLQFIEKNVFSKLKNLKNLDLSYNKLSILNLESLILDHEFTNLYI